MKSVTNNQYLSLLVTPLNTYRVLLSSLGNTLPQSHSVYKNVLCLWEGRSLHTVSLGWGRRVWSPPFVRWDLILFPYPVAWPCDTVSTYQRSPVHSSIATSLSILRVLSLYEYPPSLLVTEDLSSTLRRQLQWRSALQNDKLKFGGDGQTIIWFAWLTSAAVVWLLVKSNLAIQISPISSFNWISHSHQPVFTHNVCVFALRYF